jgi:two-component system, NtrC family, nitrogen regulation response regulator GlnG
MPSGQILLADDDAAIRTVLNQALSRAGYEVRSTSNAATLWRWVSQGDGDLVITDVMMPDENAFDLLPRIKRQRPDLPIIVMSAQNTFMTAIKASERGAYEYLPKPFDLKELVAVVGRALSRPRAVSNAPSASENEDIPLVGRSHAMQEIYRALARLMPTDLTVMITGESGTGKELVAKALHDYGKRRQGPFVAVNMAAIPRELIESESSRNSSATRRARSLAQRHATPAASNKRRGGRFFSMRSATCRWRHRHAFSECFNRVNTPRLADACRSGRTSASSPQPIRTFGR